ncbi:hypothetical protein EMIT048CA2_10514 [Pseudomonas chlororaphis]
MSAWAIASIQCMQPTTLGYPLRIRVICGTLQPNPPSL